MRPVDFHTNVLRMAEAERALRHGERPAIQQTFAAEVAKTLAERDRRVERRDETHAVQLDPRKRQNQQQGKEKQPPEEEKDGQRRRRLDVRV